jgi:hypothetical protein
MNLRRLSFAVAPALLAVALIARSARVSAAADDVVIDLPDAVKAAVKSEAAGDKILEFRRDNDGGNAGYLIVASGKAGEYQMRFDTAGLLTRKWIDAGSDTGEKAVTYEQLPKAVRDTLVDNLRGGQPKAITLREIKPTYEVHAVIGKKYYDIRLDTGGKLIEKILSNDQEEAPQR